MRLRTHSRGPRILLALAAARMLAQIEEPVGRSRDWSEHASEGWCAVRVVVDGEADISVQQAVARLTTLSGQPARVTSIECNQPLPASPESFRFRGIDGRGQVTLTAQPSPANGGTATVRIRDPRGGEERYYYRLEWRRGTPATPAAASAPAAPRAAGTQATAAPASAPVSTVAQEAPGVAAPAASRPPPASADPPAPAVRPSPVIQTYDAVAAAKWEREIDFDGTGTGYILRAGRDRRPIARCQVRIARDGAASVTLDGLTFTGRLARADHPALTLSMQSAEASGAMTIAVDSGGRVVRVGMTGGGADYFRIHWSQ